MAESYVLNNAMAYSSEASKGMKTFDLETLIDKILGQFPQRRVAVTVSPGLPQVEWEDEFLKRLLTEAFRTGLRSTSDQLPIHIALHHTGSLRFWHYRARDRELGSQDSGSSSPGLSLLSLFQSYRYARP